MRVRLFADADNMLWDTNAVFGAAQLSLARNVADLSPRPGLLDVEDEAALRLVRVLDQRLAVNHELGLRYPRSCWRKPYMFCSEVMATRRSSSRRSNCITPPSRRSRRCARAYVKGLGR